MSKYKHVSQHFINRHFILMVFLFIIPSKPKCQIQAIEILKDCIQKHDPNHTWKKLKVHFDMSIVRENAADRLFSIQMNLPKKHFSYQVKNDTIHYIQGFKKSRHYVAFNQSNIISNENIKKYDLTVKRTKYLQEVYEYLMLLPMRLENDVQYLNPKVEETTFNDRKCYQITMNYKPLGEKETWHFFIDKENFILQGYQFYLKDSNTDGEYIYLSDYVSHRDILMAKTKIWYWNKGKNYFRTDSILKIN